ncbi:membrane peroxisomal [Fusarium beomiforme]|uniref:Membrane peroxisomal n=1 Tax=Fusarium beomiforme TaxID=44412 RepID=A0A9P5DR80_9HYPO|nr:membrane peroxisomal [Fusarium beomiforme]
MSSLTSTPNGKSVIEPKALLASKPLRTKMLTQGSLSALTEIIASWFAYGRPGYGPTITSRVPQMAFYGACIAAPLTHFLNTTLQRSLPGRVILQQLVTMLLFFPIQNTVYLASMAVIAGARTPEQARAAVRAGLVPMTKAMCAMHPILITIANVFVPKEAWAPFFSLVGFCLGTFFNTLAKKRRVAAAAAAASQKESKD